jgi:hypothetical protein
MLHVVDSTAECVDRSLAEIAQLIVALGIETMSNHGIDLSRCRGHTRSPSVGAPNVVHYRRNPRLEDSPKQVRNPTKVVDSRRGIARVLDFLCAPWRPTASSPWRLSQPAPTGVGGGRLRDEVHPQDFSFFTFF